MKDPDKALAVLEKAELIDFPDMGLVFFEEDIYTWKIKYELAFLYFQSGNYKKAKNIIGKLIEFRKLPQLETAFLHSLKEKIDEILNEKT
jgi:tetratricopeptide (TPR) repeat protein